jgi:transposase
MLEFTHESAVYISCGTTDLRKSFNGLAAIIKLKFNLDPYSKCMFAFCNRSRSLIKILQWDGSGFWLHMKRLDRGNFRWPDTPDEVQKVSIREMRWLCEGLSIDQKSAFKERHPKLII